MLQSILIVRVPGKRKSTQGRQFEATRESGDAELRGSFSLAERAGI